MGTTGILAAIDEEIERLQQVKQLLGGILHCGSVSNFLKGCIETATKHHRIYG